MLVGRVKHKGESDSGLSAYQFLNSLSASIIPGGNKKGQEQSCSRLHRRTVLNMRKNRYLTAQEAANELGISLETLYAYVSRGLLRSEASDGPKRSRWYALEDVQRLKKRKGEHHRGNSAFALGRTIG
jgi:excisionase family DNA binding protein